MTQRGRKSGASLEVITPIRAVRRPKPMTDLTVEQAKEWNDVVNRLPADWFPRETHGLLAHYCRHVVSARRVGELIEGLVNGETETNNFICDYDRLLKMQEREGRAMSSLATRMRISQQSLVSKDKGTGGLQKKPPHMS